MKDREKNKSQKSIEEVLSALTNSQLNGDFEEIFKQIPVTNDTKCGILFFKGPFLQK